MKYRIEYTEKLGTEFEIEVPDTVPPRSVRDYVDRHWDELIEPDIQTSELEVLESGLYIRYA